VKFPLFKRAVAKIAEGRQVTDTERASVCCLLKPVEDADTDNDDVLDEGDMRVYYYYQVLSTVQLLVYSSTSILVLME
jgi:hypothetical protein